MMKNIELYRNEIEIINYFKDKVSSIPLVESIYLVPYFDRSENDSYVDIVAIYNESIHYNELLTGVPNEMRHMKNDITKLLKVIKEDMPCLIERNKEYFIKDCLSFRMENSDDYHLSRKTNKSHRLVKELVSSTILFDRFGIKTKQKNLNSEGINTVNRTIHPFDNILTINNIDKVLNDEKNKVKRK